MAGFIVFGLIAYFTYRLVPSLFWFVLCLIIAVNADKIVSFVINLVSFIYYKIKDLINKRKLKKSGKIIFPYFGLRCYSGRQGSGKTVSMVYDIKDYRRRFPNLKIYTNFKCDYADGQLESLNDLLTIRNGTDGVLFCIDELQNEFSSAVSKDFPETLLSTITQQRKQRIQIFSSSQVFMRMAKQLREQTFEVVECKTFLGRWTFNKCYDADEYNLFVENPDPKKRMKLLKKWKRSFVQSDELRASYDTYSVVERLSRQGFKAKLNAA